MNILHDVVTVPQNVAKQTGSKQLLFGLAELKSPVDGVVTKVHPVVVA